MTAITKNVICERGLGWFAVVKLGPYSTKDEAETHARKLLANCFNIRAVYINPPIPIRDFDYAAYDDNSYEGDPSQVVGYGATEAEAIQDFLTKMEEENA